VKIFRVLPSLFLLCSIFGCAGLSTPVPYSEAIQTPKDRLFEFQQKNEKRTSSIVVIRDEGFAGGGCFNNIWFDGTLAAMMDKAEIATFYLETGEHIIKIGNVGRGLCATLRDRIQRETLLKPNQQKYFRLLWNKGDTIPDIQPIVSP